METIGPVQCQLILKHPTSFPYMMLQKLFVSKVFVTVLLSVKPLTFTDTLVVQVEQMVLRVYLTRQ